MRVFYQDKAMRAINISDGRTGAICPIETPLYQNLATYKLEFLCSNHDLKNHWKDQNQTKLVLGMVLKIHK